MKKLILAVLVIVITAAFEQKAAVVLKNRSAFKNKPNTVEVVEKVDSLLLKFHKLNGARNEK